MRTKKLVAGLVTGALATSMLAGCSTAEMAYLDLMKETADITKMETTMEMDMTIGQDFAALLGVEEIQFRDIEAQMDIEDLYIEMSFDLLIDDEMLSDNVEVIMTAEDTYMSTSYLVDVAEYALEMEGFSDELLADTISKIEEKLDGKEYVSAYDMDETLVGMEGLSDLYETQMAMTSTLLANQEELLDLTTTYITETFDGFETGMFTQSGSKITMRLDEVILAELMKDFVTYTSENKDKVFDNTVEYIVDIYNLLDLEETMDGPTEAGLRISLDASRDEFMQAIDDLNTVYTDNESVIGEALTTFAGTYIESSTQKVGTSYEQDFDMGITLDGQELLTITGSGTTKEVSSVKKVTVSDDEVISMDDLTEILDDARDEADPVASIEIMWVAEDTTYADGFMTTEHNNIKFDSYDLYLNAEEGRIYLPLRQITESLGEEVEWDAVERKAYIVRGEEKIDMTGTIINDLTYIKVRDFEKLGYTIEYVEEDNLRIATIVK